MKFLKENFGVALLGALVIFCVTVWSAVYAQTPRGVLTFAVLNVGQGDSLYIEGPTGIEVVVDGGPDNSLLRELPKIMPLFDRSLDAVIETHPDADHIAGFIDLLKRYQVDNFIEPGIEKDTITAKNLEQEITEQKVPRVIARRGMWLNLGGGARLEILFPDFDVSHIDQKKDNDGGIVAHLVYGKTSVLLMADTSNIVEEHLMQISTSSDLKSTILKVGHHGSRFSSEDSFVSEVAPQIAVISVGAKNSYGHPTKQVLNTLASHNIETLRTDQKGTVVCTSNAIQFTCE
ncbi:MAG: MBL fold metallo-hydrolase [bacterium]|nr:MBL fold metallo-hydrolase [bacterium]